MSVASISPKRELMLGVLTPLLGRMAPTGAFSLPGDINNDARVLVIDSGDLTELLFFSPILKHLKERYPGMRVTFLVREGNSELVRAMPQISEMISYEPSHLSLSSTTFLKLVNRVRVRHFNVTFLLGSEFNFARSVLALATGAKIRIGFTSERTFPFINCEVRASSDSIYEGARVEGFLTALAMNRHDGLPAWSLPEHDLKWAKQQVHFHKPQKDVKLIAVDPGVGKGNHRIAESTFRYLVDQLAFEMNMKVLVLSNNLDRKRLSAFRSSLRADLFSLEPTNVKEGLALLSRADLFLAGNTDFFHYGVKMKIPTIGLFTRHDTSNWLPKGTPWVQILQGVKGEKVSLDEFKSKIDTLLHLTRVV